MHSLLRRQLKRLGLDEQAPPDADAWRALLDRVDRSYEEADQDRYLLERSLSISSDELRQAYTDLKAASEAELARERHKLSTLNWFLRHIVDNSSQMDASPEADAGHERDKLLALNWFLESIVEHIPDVVFVKDAATLEFVHVNRAAEALLGIGREELLGRGDHDFFPKEQADFFIATDRRVLNGKKLVTVDDEPIQTRAHGLRSLRTSKMPILDQRGEPIFLLGISRDITDEKQTRARLEEAQAHERASRAKSAFLANMSHELRTPLNSIIGFTELLEDRVPGPLNDKQARYVANVLSSSRHLLHLIGEILDLSKLEAGRMTLRLAETDVAAAVLRVGAAVQPLADKKQIALRMDVHDLELSAMLDEQRFDQILYNLFSNAVKFTPDGGSIDVTARLDGDAIAISVRDSGIGIAPEDLERIFLEFEQADSSYTRAQQGTGLGLALTKRLVELHDGRIWVESTPGLGSTFSFAIPVRRRARRSVRP